MNRLDALRNTKGKKLIVYLMAGDPDIKTTAAIIRELDRSGVSVIELGIPFSDPVADGPAIQRAGERALKSGTTAMKALKMVSQVRKTVKDPMVAMTYFNIIMDMGPERFVDRALKAGLDGAIIPDLPFDEEAGFRKYSEKKGFYLINLLAPTNTPARAKKIVESSKGFVYYILLKGVTGVRKGPATGLKAISRVKKLSNKPVFAGFGISGPAQAKDVLKYADGVIIGSSFVSIIGQCGRNRAKVLKKTREFVNAFTKTGAYGEKKG